MDFPTIRPVWVGMLGKKLCDFLAIINTFNQVLTLLPLTATFYQL